MKGRTESGRFELLRLFPAFIASQGSPVPPLAALSKPACAGPIWCGCPYKRKMTNVPGDQVHLSLSLLPTPPLIRVIRETHEAPAHVRERIARAGGANRFGEPNFGVVWGGSRLAWIGGRWTDRDAHGNVVREAIDLRRVPKYLPHDRWHIERWMPPEAYGSPEQWYAQTIEIENGIRIPALGPYPSRGEYEHCFTLAGAHGEFIPLTASACDWIVRAIEWSRRQPRNAGRASLAAREARRARDWDRAVDEILA